MMDFHYFYAALLLYLTVSGISVVGGCLYFLFVSERFWEGSKTFGLLFGLIASSLFSFTSFYSLRYETAVVERLRDFFP